MNLHVSDEKLFSKLRIFQRENLFRFVSCGAVLGRFHFILKPQEGTNLAMIPETAASQSFGYDTWETKDEEVTVNGEDSHGRSIPTRSPFIETTWSDEFHDLLIKIANTKNLTDEEEERYYESLRKLELDFVYTAETWGRVIIEEIFLPVEKKTIKPLESRGTLGGYKYEVRGVFFKFAHEIQYLVNASNAAKVSGHELRACSMIALYALENSDCSLLPPLMALVDFRGFRLLAVSQLPIQGDDSLVYGSNDGGLTIKNSDPRFRDAIEKMGEHFNLAGHLSGIDNQTVVYTGSDIEGHYANDRYYILDLARFFPPEAPLNELESKKEHHSQVRTWNCTQQCPCRSWRNKVEQSLLDDEKYEEKVLDNPRLHKQLRPFLVQQKKETPPLSSDAFSKFQSAFDADESNRRVQEQSDRLRTTYVSRAATYLKHREGDSILYPALFTFSHFLHERGINIRMLGLIFQSIPYSSNWWKIIMIEMIARSFKSVLRRRFRAIARRKRDHDDFPPIRGIWNALKD